MRVITGLAILITLASSSVPASAEQWCGFLDKASARVQCGFSSEADCKQAISGDAICIPDPYFAENKRRGFHAQPVG
jgi:Protein of unknown function (DUF3551)